MIIYNVSLGSYGLPSSGGDRFISELISRLAREHLNLVYFGYNNLPQEWASDKNIKIINILKSNIQRNLTSFETLILYFIIFLKSLKWIKPIDNKEGVVISHSDAWPDTLFTYLFKVKNKNINWIAINHMILPNPFKGYKYVYTKKIKIPSLVDIYHWCNQRLFFLLQKKADLLVSINSNDLKYLLTKNKNVLIIKHGREYTKEPNFGLENKIYDICFLGRFTKQKGIDEIPDIFSKLRDIYNRKLRVIFIAEQNAYSEWLNKRLMHLGYDINFAGFKYVEEKFALLNKTKILIFPSYFESFGIVYLDAISVGIPVVEYDLPCFADHKYGVVKVPFKDNNAFANTLKTLLSDKILYKKISSEGYQYSKEFSWDKTAESLKSYINYMG